MPAAVTAADGGCGTSQRKVPSVTRRLFIVTLSLEGDRIFVDYQARFSQKSVNSLPLRGGSFEITGGTGRFADISGEGSFRGELTCLQGTLENAQDHPQNCAELGFFSDAAFDLRGSYQDPTVPTS